MKKLTLSLYVLFSCLHSTAQQTDDIASVAGFIVKDCIPSATRTDSVAVVNMLRSISEAYKIKRWKLVANGTGSSHYVPFTHTMYLNLNDTNSICRAINNELPHALQFSSRPLRSSMLFAQGFIDTFRGVFAPTKAERKEMKLLRESGCTWVIARFWVIYKRQEHIHGTAEYRAHIELQPKIESMFYGLLYHLIASR